GRGIETRVDIRGVGARAAVDRSVRLVVVRVDRVVPACGCEAVLPGATRNDVVSVAGADRVVTGTTQDDVGGILRVDDVATGTAVDEVDIRATPQERVVAVVTVEGDRPEEV